MVNRSRGTQVKRRETEWFTTNQGFLPIVAGAQANLTLFSASLIGARFVKGTTITRMIIDVIARNDAVAQTSILHWGIVPVNADARAAGAFPDADDMSDRAGWLMRGRLVFNSNAVSDSSQWAQRHYDLRSQRVLRNEEEELQFIIDSTSSFTADWSAYIRVLVKWP